MFPPKTKWLPGNKLRKCTFLTSYRGEANVEQERLPKRARAFGSLWLPRQIAYAKSDEIIQQPGGLSQASPRDSAVK